MTVFSLAVFDPLSSVDNKIIPKDRDCIDFWKKTLQGGQASELYETFQQTAQDLLFRAQIQTVSDVDIVAFVRFLCYIEAIRVELVEKPPSLCTENNEKTEKPNTEETTKDDSQEVKNSSTMEKTEGKMDRSSEDPKNAKGEKNKTKEHENEDSSEGENVLVYEEYGDNDFQPDAASLGLEVEDEEGASSNQGEPFSCKECEEKFYTTWDYDIHFYTKHAPEPKPISKSKNKGKQASKKPIKVKVRVSPKKRKREDSPDINTVFEKRSEHNYQSRRLRAKYGYDDVLNRDCPAQIRDLSKLNEPEEGNDLQMDEAEDTKDTNDDTEVTIAVDKTTVGDGDAEVSINIDVKNNPEDTVDNEVADNQESLGDDGNVTTSGDSATVDKTEVSETSEATEENAPKRGRPRGSSGLPKTKRAYPCQLCSEQIYGPDFKDHMLNVHKVDSAVPCSTCKRVFYSHNMLLEHVERHRARNLNKYACSICGKHLKNIYLLEYHEKAHSKPEQCSLCEKTFSTPGTLKRHMTVHTQETRFKCKYCPKEFYHHNKCKKHEASHEERKFKCDVCGVAFHFKSGLETHMKTHNPDRELVHCDICQKSFKAKGNLNTHIQQVHEKVKTHPCSICGVKFGKMSTRKRHEATHTDVKPYQCELCGKNFREKGHLKRHVEWHKGEQKHMCDVCGRLFSFKDNMLKHRRIHTGETPYTCDLCSQSFSYIEQLKKHKKKLHTVVLSDDVQYETTLDVPTCKAEQTPASNSIISDAIQACLSLDIESTIEIM